LGKYEKKMVERSEEGKDTGGRPDRGGDLKERGGERHLGEGRIEWRRRGKALRVNVGIGEEGALIGSGLKGSVSHIAGFTLKEKEKEEGERNQPNITGKNINHKERINGSCRLTFARKGERGETSVEWEEWAWTE